jgi:hypothetical protein
MPPRFTERTCYVIENKGLNIRKSWEAVIFNKTGTLYSLACYIAENERVKSAVNIGSDSGRWTP